MSRHFLGTALVTGASTGIGASYADRLARRGYDLVLVARNQEKLEKLAENLRKDVGVDVDVLRADLGEKGDLARVEDRLRKDERITVLVNNAGISVPREIVGVDLDKLEALVQVNVLALTRLAGVAATQFAARKRGAIINIASVLALAPELTSATYAGSKGYVLNFTLALHQELAPLGVQVQAVLPGVTRTDIWKASGRDVNSLPAHMIMEVDEMVDASLAGLDQKELVTIPSLPDVKDWEAYNAARLHLGPNLSHNLAAERYKSSRTEEAALNATA